MKQSNQSIDICRASIYTWLIKKIATHVSAGALFIATHINRVVQSLFFRFLILIIFLVQRRFATFRW